MENIDRTLVEEKLGGDDAELEAFMHREVPANLFFVRVEKKSEVRQRLDAKQLAGSLQSRPSSKLKSESSVEFALTLIKRIEAKLCDKEGNRCGFSQEKRHQDVCLHAEDCVAEKNGGGLYRSVQSRRGIAPSPDGTAVYFEVQVIAQPGGSGMSIGMAPTGAPLNKMVGSAEQHIGFYSTGHMVTGNVWEKVDRSYKAGDVVGCAVRYDPACSTVEEIRDGDSEDGVAPQSEGAAYANLMVEFSVNGEAAGAHHLRFPRDAAPELFPTISLLGKGSKVALRCCREDQAFPPHQISSSLCGSPISRSSSQM